MKTPLAWLNLVHSKMRTAAALAGVAFAVVLVFMQLGFLGSCERTASMIYDALDFDLVVRSRSYVHVSDARSFPRSRLFQAASMPGVRRVSPLHVAPNQWRNPVTGRKRRILVMGANPEDEVFQVEEIKRKAFLLTTPKCVLIDRESRAEFGPKDGKQFGDADIGAETEAGGQRVQIVGHFALGAAFEADGAIVASQQGFRRVQPGRKGDDVSLALVKLHDGIDVEAAVAGLRAVLPKDVDVLSREEVVDFERQFWIREMSIGVVFQVGVAVALLVGMAIVYQVLSSDVSNHLAEYATLKAVGYGNIYLAKVVLQQAVMLSLLGFVPGIVLAAILYRVASHATRLPIEMNAARVAFVLTLTIVMCTSSGLGALRKVYQADPADLF